MPERRPDSRQRGLAVACEPPGDRVLEDLALHGLKRVGHRIEVAARSRTGMVPVVLASRATATGPECHQHGIGTSDAARSYALEMQAVAPAVDRIERTIPTERLRLRLGRDRRASS